VAIQREPGRDYGVKYKRVDLSDVAAKTRHMPPEFISGTSDVSRKFLAYARPLVGELPEMVRI
jgi:6-phosphofructokinase 1